VFIEQDGVPGSGPPETAELVTTNTRSGSQPVPTGCGQDNSFCGDVTLRSFYTTNYLLSTFVQFDSMSPATGFEPFNTDSPPGGVTPSAYGGFSHGDVACLGGTGLRTWFFNTPSQQNFGFLGTVYATFAQLPSLATVPDSGAAGSTAQVNAANFNPGEMVQVLFGPGVLVAQGAADANGQFESTFTVPPFAGNNSVEADGQTSGNQAFASFTVE
jgi:hypothetical protein